MISYECQSFSDWWLMLTFIFANTTLSIAMILACQEGELYGLHQDRLFLNLYWDKIPFIQITFPTHSTWDWTFSLPFSLYVIWAMEGFLSENRLAKKVFEQALCRHKIQVCESTYSNLKVHQYCISLNMT